MLRKLFREYLAWLGSEGWLTDIETELAALPRGYEAALVGRLDREVVGCVALKRLADGVCEMKWLYVHPAERDSGLGRNLVEASIERAWALRYAVSRLDTLPKMDAARSL